MGGKISCLRSPKTGNERRANAGAGKRFVRGKSRPKALPSDWDDKSRGSQRSWKVTRAKQYREDVIEAILEVAAPMTPEQKTALWGSRKAKAKAKAKAKNFIQRWRKNRLVRAKARKDARKRDFHSAMVFAHELDHTHAQKKLDKARLKLSKRPNSARWQKKYRRAKRAGEVSRAGIRKYKKKLGEEARA
jgi:thioesterase domain-containing protein